LLARVPAAPRLIGNRARRDTLGPFEPGIRGGLPPAQLLPLAAHARLSPSLARGRR